MARRQAGSPSLPPRGAWIEISIRVPLGIHLRSLPPRGAWIEIQIFRSLEPCIWRSLPPRGAWIEISRMSTAAFISFGRSPRGERGLKSVPRFQVPSSVSGRSPRGERGLKSSVSAILLQKGCRSPRGERGLKLGKLRFLGYSGITSLPPRGAWIEIGHCPP